MEDIILEDDCKKECKRMLVAITGGGVCIVMLFAGSIIIAKREGLEISAVLILIFFVLFYCLYLLAFIYFATYKIQVTKNEIFYKAFSRTIKIDLNKPFEYTYKNASKKSQLYDFNIIIDNKKILISTRYYLEFDGILQSKLREQAERAAKTEVSTKTDSNDNLQ